MGKKKDFEYTNEELVEIAKNCPDFSSPAFQLYVNDFLGSNKILMMDTEAVAGYFFLLLVEWNEKDCGIPTDDTSLVKISRLLPEVWERVKKSILSNFFLLNNRYYNRRLLLERKKQINMRNQRKDAIRNRYESSTKDLREDLRGEVVNEVENENENENEKDLKEEERKKTILQKITENPSELFIRYFPRDGTDQERQDAKEYVQKYGAEKVIYAFHEANKQGVFKTAYIRKILENLEGKIIPPKAKADAENLEKQSAENKRREVADLKVLQENEKKREKELWTEVKLRFDKIRTDKKILQKKKEDIQRAINEKNLMKADRLLYEIESSDTEKGRRNDVEIPGIKSISESIKSITA